MMVPNFFNARTKSLLTITICFSFSVTVFYLYGTSDYSPSIYLDRKFDSSQSNLLQVYSYNHDKVTKKQQLEFALNRSLSSNASRTDLKSEVYHKGALLIQNTEAVTKPFEKNSTENETITKERLTPENIVDQSICNDIRLMPRFSLPVIALASLPGSGNTWLRYLLERATGVYTGSIYDDKELMKGGFVGEGIRPYMGRTIVVKMHEIKRPLKINRTILLVRDPYDAILSDFNRRSGNDKLEDVHKKVVNESLYRTPAWPICVRHSLSGMKTLFSKVLSLFAQNERLLVVYYVDLKTNLPDQLRKIINFLGLSVDENRLKCTVRTSEGTFRRPRYSLPFNPYDKHLTALVEETKRDIEDLMKRFDLSPPRFKESIYNDWYKLNATHINTY